MKLDAFQIPGSKQCRCRRKQREGNPRRFIYILKRHRDTEDQKGRNLVGRIRKSISTEGKIF